MIKLPHVKQASSESLVKTVTADIKAGIHFVTKENTKIGKILLVSGFIGLFFFPVVFVVLPALLSTYFEVTEAVLGIIQGVVVFGGTAGVIFLGFMGEKATISQTRMLLIASSLALLLAGVSLTWSNSRMVSMVMLIISFFIIMAISTMFAIIGSSYIGENTPEYLLGKVTSLDYAVAMGTIALGNYIFGFLLNHFIDTVGIVLLIVGGIAIIGAYFLRITE